MTEDKTSTLREHEKFWAFIILVAAILSLALLSSFMGDSLGTRVSDAELAVLNAKLRIIDVSIAGLIGIAGMAAQALFRVSSVDKLTAETALVAANKLPDAPPSAPQPVEVVNTPANPAIVTELASSEELPDYAK